MFETVLLQNMVKKMVRTFSKARFPLDRNAIVKSHDQNSFWLIANVSVKIYDINMTHAG